MGKLILIIILILAVAGIYHDREERRRIEEENRQKEELGAAILGGVISGVLESQPAPRSMPEQPIRRTAPQSYNLPMKDGVNHYDADGNYIGRSQDSYRGVQP